MAISVVKVVIVLVCSCMFLLFSILFLLADNENDIFPILIKESEEGKESENQIVKMQSPLIKALDDRYQNYFQKWIHYLLYTEAEIDISDESFKEAYYKSLFRDNPADSIEDRIRTAFSHSWNEIIKQKEEELLDQKQDIKSYFSSTSFIQSFHIQKTKSNLEDEYFENTLDNFFQILQDERFFKKNSAAMDELKLYIDEWKETMQNYSSHENYSSHLMFVSANNDFFTNDETNPYIGRVGFISLNLNPFLNYPPNDFSLLLNQFKNLSLSQSKRETLIDWLEGMVQEEETKKFSDFLNFLSPLTKESMLNKNNLPGDLMKNGELMILLLKLFNMFLWNEKWDNPNLCHQIILPGRIKHLDINYKKDTMAILYSPIEERGEANKIRIYRNIGQYCSPNIIVNLTIEENTVQRCESICSSELKDFINLEYFGFSECKCEEYDTNFSGNLMEQFPLLDNAHTISINNNILVYTKPMDIYQFRTRIRQYDQKIHMHFWKIGPNGPLILRNLYPNYFTTDLKIVNENEVLCAVVTGKTTDNMTVSLRLLQTTPQYPLENLTSIPSNLFWKEMNFTGQSNLEFSARIDVLNSNPSPKSHFEISEIFPYHSFVVSIIKYFNFAFDTGDSSRLAFEMYKSSKTDLSLIKHISTLENNQIVALGRTDSEKKTSQFRNENLYFNIVKTFLAHEKKKEINSAALLEMYAIDFVHLKLLKNYSEDSSQIILLGVHEKGIFESYFLYDNSSSSEAWIDAEIYSKAYSYSFFGFGIFFFAFLLTIIRRYINQSNRRRNFRNIRQNLERGSRRFEEIRQRRNHQNNLNPPPIDPPNEININQEPLQNVANGRDENELEGEIGEEGEERQLLE